jgi:type IV pilus assembly protein PilF
MISTKGLKKGFVALSLLAIWQLCGCAHTNQDLNKAAQTNVQLGLAYLDNNEMSLAKKTLLEAKREAPNEPSVWYGMGYFLERTADFPAAEDHYRRAINLSSNRGPALNNYGAFLCRQKRFREALNAFEGAVADPHYLEPALAYVNAGICALKIPNQHLAGAYFQKALAKDPSVTVPDHFSEVDEA